VIIAIDGPAAAGKGTLARRLASHFGLGYLDTGLLYRAVGKKVIDQGGVPDDPEFATAIAEALNSRDLDVEGLRTEVVGQAASMVSAVPGVRSALLQFQRDFAKSPPEGMNGAVLDGRDICTVVCPDATVKLFITASAEVRAERRLKELLGRGSEAIYARVLEDMKERDARDSSRATAPLAPAADARVLDTSDLDAGQAFDEALEFINTRI